MIFPTWPTAELLVAVAPATTTVATLLLQ